LSLPVNVTVEPVADAAMSSNTRSYRARVHGAPVAEVKSAMTALLKCNRPLLFLGNGCRQALYDERTYSNLLQFVESYAIPVITTADGKGIFPETHELSLRVYGIADCMWPYQYLSSAEPAYDGIMVIGSELGELSTNSWLPILKPAGTNDPFIQVDINQKTIGQSFEVTHGIVGEAGAFINDLAGMISDFPPDQTQVSGRRKSMAEIKQSTPFLDPTSYYADNSPLEPAAMMRVVQECMPSGTKIFIDAGNCVGWSVHYLAVDPPSSIFTSLAMGPMGFGVASVIGGRLGCPDSTCISITGDGAFMMQGSEISTAAQYKVGAIWIVLFDNNLGMVSQGMEQFFPDKDDPGVWQSMYTLGNPDLELYARSMGADAYAASDTAGFKTALSTAIRQADKENKPQVIIATINKQQIPPYYNPIYAPVKPK
ncbi:MAG: thiamine pyrophosphate-binding protein, partial [Sphingobacteriales bacterium]